MIDRRYLLAPIDEDDDFLMDAEYVELESDLREYSVEADELDDQERAEVVIAQPSAPPPPPAVPAPAVIADDLDFEPIPDIIDSAPILAAAAAARSVVGPVTVVRRAIPKKVAPAPPPPPPTPAPAKKAPAKKVPAKPKKAPAKKKAPVDPVKKKAPAKKAAPKKKAAPPKKKTAAKNAKKKKR